MDGPIITLKTKLFVYISHFLSAWGDRMWQFGIGLFLVELAPDSLQLVAIYGFASGVATLLLSTALGDWVDKTPRLKAARVSLVAQNICVALCAVVVFVVYTYLDEIREEWADEMLLKLCFGVIILLGIFADLGSVASTIVIERDWVVELCQHDTNLLSTMTSTLRSIDLTTKLVAPIVTGQVIYFLDLGYGGVFVAGWNIVSLFAEYIMVKMVYDQIPSLANEKFKTQPDNDDETTRLIGNEHTPEYEKSFNNEVVIDVSCKSHEFDKRSFMKSDHVKSFDVNKQNGGLVPNGTSKQNGGPSDNEKHLDMEEELKKESSLPSCCYTTFYSFIVLHKGWQTFMKYDVAFAGMGLATLYMTVLGFDNITVGYSYSQGISESLLGILMAVGSVFGIAGTFAYPVFRKRIGLKATGLLGSVLQICCLSACVVSVFLSGSPFDLLHRLNEDNNASSAAAINGSDLTTFYPSSTFNPTTNFENISTTSIPVTSENASVFAVTALYENTTSAASTDDEPESYLSIGVFLGGLIVARFGLWMFDLSVTQLFLQTVKERERGLVSGVQNSLNQLMDMLKALMVILAPYPEEFGLLTFISFGFVCLGGVLYTKFLVSNRHRTY